ncbi:MAG TPA: sugar phosphate nucleotidyltransferase [Candidatus Acidoferrales bacterium]|nr:sugar phosphate nucleotidyltransferase [Candidatus Acidoferrales bacterium]
MTGPSKRPAFSAHAVILAGGRGTRFWPRSRTRTPKQFLNIVGARTMFEQTVDRLLPLFPYPRLWTVTNAEQAASLRKLAPRIRPAQILVEPTGRNTAAAIALAAFHLARKDANALMAVLPADHFIRDARRYRFIVRAALQVAARGPNLLVLGIPPTRPETGYGYVERGASPSSTSSTSSTSSAPPPSPPSVFRVSRFTEKPDLETAREFLSSGNYYWNAGMFFWRATTYLDCLRRFLPATHDALARVAKTIGTRRYASALARAYPELENISVDYAILERATREPGGGNVFVLPADIGWSDIGSWAAVYELSASAPGANVSRSPLCAIDSSGNYVWSAKKIVALLGVNDLVVVETPDALLICPRSRAQDVGKVVKSVEAAKRKLLL